MAKMRKSSARMKVEREVEVNWQAQSEEINFNFRNSYVEQDKSSTKPNPEGLPPQPKRGIPKNNNLDEQYNRLKGMITDQKHQVEQNLNVIHERASTQLQGITKKNLELYRSFNDQQADNTSNI